ncbi:MAG: TatD family hydrolase, partial [Mariprofundus sp.]|nr:TatD family hydrolase [Mariprofundus sp.]
GESGMDFFRNSVEPELQESRFRTHLQAAKACNKPIIVHDRNADEASIRILTDEGADRCGGIMHCFSSDWQTAKQAIDLGFSISFSGNVTFKNNPALREVAAQVPDDLLLIETDSPYLTPVPYRGKRNEPAYVRHIAECIAEVRGVSLETLAKQTTANALKRFNIGA